MTAAISVALLPVHAPDAVRTQAGAHQQPCQNKVSQMEPYRSGKFERGLINRLLQVTQNCIVSSGSPCYNLKIVQETHKLTDADQTTFLYLTI